MTPRRCERISEPLSAVSTWASSSSRFSTPSATACRIARALVRAAVAAQAGKAARAAATAASTSAWPPRAISASGRSSIGLTSVNVSRRADARAADPVPRVDRGTGDEGRLAHGWSLRGGLVRWIRPRSFGSKRIRGPGSVKAERLEGGRLWHPRVRRPGGRCRPARGGTRSPAGSRPARCAAWTSAAWPRRPPPR